MSFEVISAGSNTAVQDLGRYGYASLGLGPGGVMDPVAMKRANLLVGNYEDEAVLEFCLLAPVLHFNEPAVIAVSGGDFTVTVDKKAFHAEVPVHVPAGGMVSINQGKSGMWGVIALRGGLDIEPLMGSRSTNIRCGIGGYMGRALKRGDILGIRPHAPFGLPRRRVLPERSLPPEGSEITIHVIPGPQQNMFSPGALDVFLNSGYEVTTHSDRMGTRLSGWPVPSISGSDIISDGIANGSIQIPADGMPIVMLADRQTTGGYAKIATVAGVDLPVFAQLRPGTRVRFESIDVCLAQKLLRQSSSELQKMRAEAELPEWTAYTISGE